MFEYLNAFNEGLIKVLPLSTQGTETFLYMMLGMAIGFAVGILPGLGGATTLALMLPFIYNMDPITAFAFLLGSNAVTDGPWRFTSNVDGRGTNALRIDWPVGSSSRCIRASADRLTSSMRSCICRCCAVSACSTFGSGGGVSKFL